MSISISHAYPIKSAEVRAAGKPCITPTIIEPFTAGRSAPRLLFDFGVMASLMNTSVLDEPVLDFGSGIDWVSEFGARMGLQTVAFDIHGNLQACLEGRAKADSRIDPGLMSFAHGDGHAMPFEPGAFGHLLCYDTLHHMHGYPKVFAEFFRVWQGGRGIFVKPGARPSTSPETVALVAAQKKHDPSWIERDVVLDEIDQIARAAGRIVHRAEAARAGSANLLHGSLVTVPGWGCAGALVADGSTRQSQLLGSRHFLRRQASAKVKANHAHRL